MPEFRTRSIDDAFSEARVLGGMSFAVQAVLVAGRYELLRRIGSGAFGVVYEALDRDLHRRVAVKVLDLDDPDVAKREGQMLAALEHPNIVRIFDHGQGPDYRYFVLQLLEGPTLREWCLSKSPEQIVGKFAEAGRGLEAAHRAGLVHRDFKPGNVRIGPHGQAVVVDFGMARHAESLEDDSEERRRFAGTLAYTAPERLVGETGSDRSDQFSFCVALWECLSGANPFGRPSRDAIAHDRYRAIQAGVRGQPRGPAHVRRALLRGLSLMPSGRHASMGALLSELEPKRRTLRGTDLAAAGLVLLLAGLVGGQLVGRGRDAEGGSLASGINDLMVDSRARDLARRGDADGALQLLENAQRSGERSDLRELAELSRDVAVLLESNGLWEDAVLAWGLTIRFARDGDHHALERLGHMRIYSAAARVNP